MGTYANLNTIKFDENRYQTIGRGHGFSELDGVQFKISDKYSYQPAAGNILQKLQSLHLDSQSVRSMYNYSFELEEKVLKNMDGSGRNS